MIIDELVALFRIQPDPAGAAEAEGLLNRLANRQEEVSAWQDRLAAGVALTAAGVAAGWWAANTQYESLRNSLDLVTGSAEATVEAMRFLEDFATTSPDALTQITSAYQMLVAQGLDPSRERLTALGDTAAAVQTDIATLVDALSGGVIGNTERLDEAFGRFGINFSSRNGTLFAQMGDDLVEVGSTFQEISEFAENLGRTRFAGGMERQAATLDGALANVGDTLYSLFVALGDEGVREQVQQLVREFGRLLKSGQPVVRLFARMLVGPLELATDLLSLAAENTELVTAALMGLGAVAQGALIVGIVNQLRSLGFAGALVAAEAAAVPLAIGAAILGTALLLEDFLGWLDGKDSVIGVFVGRFAGTNGVEGQIAQVFLDMRENGVEALQLMAADVKAVWESIRSGFTLAPPAWAAPYIAGLDEIRQKLSELRAELVNLVPEELRPLISFLTPDTTISGFLRNNTAPGVIAQRFAGGGSDRNWADWLMGRADAARGGSYFQTEDGTRVRMGRETMADPTMLTRARALQNLGSLATDAMRDPRTPVRQLTVNGITVPIVINGTGPVDTDSIVADLVPRMPALLQDALRLAYDRSEAELE